MVVENDVSLAVLGEHWRGAAQGHDTCVFISLGWASARASSSAASCTAAITRWRARSRSCAWPPSTWPRLRDPRLPGDARGASTGSCVAGTPEASGELKDLGPALLRAARRGTRRRGGDRRRRHAHRDGRGEPQPRDRPLPAGARRAARARTAGTCWSGCAPSSPGSSPGPRRWCAPRSASGAMLCGSLLVATQEARGRLRARASRRRHSPEGRQAPKGPPFALDAAASSHDGEPGPSRGSRSGPGRRRDLGRARVRILTRPPGTAPVARSGSGRGRACGRREAQRRPRHPGHDAGGPPGVLRLPAADDPERSTRSPAGASLFTHASSVAPLTLPAHSSIMTGMQPTYHGVRVNGNTALGQSQETLAEVLSKGLPDGGLRRRVRPRRAVGAQPGLRSTTTTAST